MGQARADALPPTLGLFSAAPDAVFSTADTANGEFYETTSQRNTVLEESAWRDSILHSS